MELPYISQPDWGDFMQILEDCYRSLHNDRTTRIPNANARIEPTFRRTICSMDIHP